MNDNEDCPLPPISDPIEKMVAAALDLHSIKWRRGAAADFFLPEYDTAIEVKQFYSPRIAKQMQHNHNVIVIQGRKAAECFAKLLLRTMPMEVGSDVIDSVRAAGVFSGRLPSTHIEEEEKLDPSGVGDQPLEK